MVCSTRRHSSPIAAALAPTPEAQAGNPDTTRRPAPGVRAGTQWWNIAFAPLAGGGGLHGIVGFIRVVGESAPHATRKLPASLAALREKHAAPLLARSLRGKSPAVERFQGQLRHAAQSSAPVWLTGEPGSGKETAARVIHHAGPHRDRAFVAIDCLGLQPFLVESLLFGHGGLLAAGHIGTLYLKDPAALPRDLQQQAGRLLRGDAERAAAHLRVDALRAGGSAEGRLVGEFHTALSVLELRVPPLRERAADLARIASHFLPGVKVEADALDVLRVQNWAGNLRELRDALAAATSTNGSAVKRENLPREFACGPASNRPRRRRDH